MYLLCLKEWNLDSFMYRRLWNPLKLVGNQMNFFTLNRVLYIFIPTYLLGLFCVYHKELIAESIQQYFPLLFSFIGLIMILKGFTERNLRNFRQFYLTFADKEIRHTLCAELSWSHIRLIMKLTNKSAQQYYLKEAAENNWSVRTLDRNISTLYYQRPI